MATLNDYLMQTQRFLREQKQDFLNPKDLIAYINRARRETAMRAQCVRRLTPISGSVKSATVTAGGSGYSATPAVTISAPDFPSGIAPHPNGDQATAAAIVVGGVIQQIVINYGGHGYFQPTVTITDTTGTGATATAQVSGLNLLVPNQEQYSFTDIDVSMFPGVSSVFTIRSVSVIYSNYRYSLPMYPFSVYQAAIRQYPYQYTYVPVFASQFGQGDQGSFFAYPLPSQVYQWEFDCFCLPQDLIDNQSEDVIPNPWTDAVAYWAACLAYEELQNLNYAKYYADKFDAMLLRYSQYARPGRMTNPYGRW